MSRLERGRKLFCCSYPSLPSFRAYTSLCQAVCMHTVFTAEPDLFGIRTAWLQSPVKACANLLPTAKVCLHFMLLSLLPASVCSGCVELSSWWAAGTDFPGLRVRVTVHFSRTLPQSSTMSGRITKITINHISPC